MRGKPLILPREILGRPAELRQLAFGAAQIFRRVLPLVARLDRADVIKDHAVHVQHLLIVLNFLGVLEEIAHHPGMGERGVDALYRFFRSHGSHLECGGATPLWMLGCLVWEQRQQEASTNPKRCRATALQKVTAARLGRWPRRAASPPEREWLLRPPWNRAPGRPPVPPE